MLQIIHTFMSNPSLIQSSPKITGMIPSLYKTLLKYMQATTERHLQNQIIDILSTFPSLTSTQVISLTSEELLTTLLRGLHETDERMDCLLPSL